MRKIALIFLLLTACAGNPIDTPKTPEEMELWVQAEKTLQAEERKGETLWMYSTGSFALFAIGLGILAFTPARRMAGFVFIAGGVCGMASVWVFDSSWFPWVAGTTVGLILLSGLAFAWVSLYNRFINRSAKPSEGCDE